MIDRSVCGSVTIGATVAGNVSQRYENKGDDGDTSYNADDNEPDFGNGDHVGAGRSCVRVALKDGYCSFIGGSLFTAVRICRYGVA